MLITRQTCDCSKKNNQILNVICNTDPSRHNIPATRLDDNISGTMDSGLNAVCRRHVYNMFKEHRRIDIPEGINESLAYDMKHILRGFYADYQTHM